MTKQMKHKMNLLVTLNEAYLPHLNTLLFSVLYHNPDTYFTVYLLHTSIREEMTEQTKVILGTSGELVMIEAEGHGLDDAPTTDRFPKEMYYRIFAAKYLPENVDRVLYLDPDIIVNGSLNELYEMPLGENYFAAASHNGKIMRLINGLRLGLKEGTPYINSGVLLINLELLRREQNYEDVFEYIKEKKKKLFLPDQDVISGLYGKKIVKLDTYIYNMTDRLYRYDRSLGKHRNFEWYREHSVVFHYCGKNKPWKEDYSGVFGVFYQETLARMGLVCESERITANA